MYIFTTVGSVQRIGAIEQIVHQSSAYPTHIMNVVGLVAGALVVGPAAAGARKEDTELLGM